MSDEPPPAAGGLSRDDAFRVLGALGAILTLVTAVMFYFGWRRSDAQSRIMGIDVSLFGFTSQDYVLRSISSLYLPLLLLAGVGLLWVKLHSIASARLTRRAAANVEPPDPIVVAARWVAVLGAVLAGSCLIFTLMAGSSDPPYVIEWIARVLSPIRWVIPLLLIACVVVVAYCGWVRRVLGPPPSEPRPSWVSILTGALAAVVVVLSGFWILEEYAAAVGRGYALRQIEDVDQLPRATVTSPAPLDIHAPGVTENAVDDHGVVVYRTTGLRLLARSGSKILLVHDGWAPGSGVVVVLPDSDTFNWEFS